MQSSVSLLGTVVSWVNSHGIVVLATMLGLCVAACAFLIWVARRREKAHNDVIDTLAAQRDSLDIEVENLRRTIAGTHARVKEEYRITSYLLTQGSVEAAFLDRGVEAEKGIFGSILKTSARPNGMDLTKFFFTTLPRITDLERWVVDDGGIDRMEGLGLNTVSFEFPAIGGAIAIPLRS